ncbi:hypothetical protein NUF60_000203 [Yersinia enterocolitica]|nr:hypothetical protein [Yersinia enterocolitica]
MSKFKCRLINLLCFFFGIVVTVIVLWILYKDPTRITAPALAALTAMCTFLLALCSALKVDEWLKNKINDSAYKQTESILEDIANLMIITEVVRKTIYNYADNKGTMDDLKKGKENLQAYNIKFISLHESVNIKIKMLRHWNTKTTNEFDEATNVLSTSIKYANEYIEKNINLTHSQNRFIDNIYIINELKSAIEAISKMNYNEVFIHNDKITSPVEKVSE